MKYYGFHEFKLINICMMSMNLHIKVLKTISINFLFKQ